VTAVLFPGDNCDTLQYSKNVQEKESENYGSMAAGVVVALILVAIIVGLLFYYRRRVANLKTEIAHVQYIADPQAAPGNAEHILLKSVTLCALFYAVAYPGIFFQGSLRRNFFFQGGSTNSVEGRENGDLGVVAPHSGVPLDLQMNETRILITLLWMYIPRNWEFSSALSKLRNFGGSLNPPNPALSTPLIV
jgi:hypothetical protein